MLDNELPGVNLETNTDTHQHSLHQPSFDPTKQQGTLTSYLVGFSASLMLTLLTYGLVKTHFLTGWTLNLVVAGLSLVQVIIQLLCFLHLGDEAKPRWNFLAFLFMVSVVLILVLGSLWIIYNLNGRMMNSMLHE